MTTIQRKIIGALNYGPLDQFQIAADICEAPFRVRAELLELRRGRYVRKHDTAQAILWDLTAKGQEVAAGGIFDALAGS